MIVQCCPSNKLKCQLRNPRIFQSLVRINFKSALCLAPPRNLLRTKFEFIEGLKRERKVLKQRVRNVRIDSLKSSLNVVKKRPMTQKKFKALLKWILCIFISSLIQKNDKRKKRKWSSKEIQLKVCWRIEIFCSNFALLQPKSVYFFKKTCVSLIQLHWGDYLLHVTVVLVSYRRL